MMVILPSKRNCYGMSKCTSFFLHRMSTNTGVYVLGISVIFVIMGDLGLDMWGQVRA